MLDHDWRSYALPLPPPKPDTLDALMARHGGAPRDGDIATPSESGTTCGHMSTPEPPTALAARTLYLRRQLAAAVDHAAAMLPMLGALRVVGPDFVPIDISAAGDALDAAVAALDAIDGDPDLEDGGDDEATGDDELSLGWRVTASQATLDFGSDDGEGTALESHGRGFVRAGPDDAEDDDNGMADAEGVAEQLARVPRAPVLPLSRGGLHA